MIEKVKEKEMMDALIQKRSEEDKKFGEQRKQQQEFYRNALDQQKSPPYSIGGPYDSKKDKAALAMEAGIDPSRPNPIAGGYKPYSGYHGGSVLRGAALSALQSK